MDLLEVLLVLIFFGVPLLGRLLQRNAPQEPQLPPVDSEAEDAEWLPAPAPRRETAPAPAQGGGWSAGWGEWPGMETAEEEEETEEAGAWAAPAERGGEETIHTLEAVSLEPVTPREAVERPVPVPVSLELVQVDRKAEHERLHQKYARPVAPRPRADRLADHLNSRGELRRAVLLAEVLGPPRALREIGGER